MLLLVWALYAAFGVVSASVAPLVGPISRDLALSSGQMGLVLGAWQLAYIAVAYSTGRLMDRLGPRTALALGGVIMAISTALRGAAVDFFSLFFMVALFAIGGSLISIGAPKVVALWFGQRERGIATGVYATAPVAGSVIAFSATNSLIVPLVGHWRGVFLVYGGLTIVVTAIWWLLARDRASRENPTAGGRQTFSGLGTLLAVPNVRFILLLAMGAFFINHGFNQWLPTVLSEKGLTPARAGLLASVPSIIGVIGLLTVPSLLLHGKRRFGLGLLLLTTAAAMASIAAFHPGGGLLTALLFAGLARGPLMALLTLLLMETPEVGTRRLGTATGAFFAAAEIGGFTGPLFMGLLRDITGSLSSGLLMLTAMGLLMAPLTLRLTEERTPQEKRPAP